MGQAAGDRAAVSPRWQLVVLLEPVGRRGADRCLCGRNRWAICLSECHVKPHLVVSDVAAGQ